MTEPYTTSKRQRTDIKTYKQIPISCNLKAIRIAKGLTQSGLAREVGCTSEYINMVEHQKHFPTLEMRIKIAQALGCDSTAIWIPGGEK